ncbi:MAG: pyruvoyl-dependent arginine decarboxylase [Candidatus Heimdallarchaeaceae archaeon]
MKIRVTWGVGEGPTELAAFDKALYNAGIANFNLIPLTSVIPKKSKVEVKKVNWNEKAYGAKLYLVLSKCVETRKGKEACAGLGWIQSKDGKGLFVEHGGSLKEVKRKIKESLDNMKKYRKETYGEINEKIVKIKCRGKPACALVAAVYKIEKW